ADARLLVANQEGYAFWSKYESFLHLDQAVQMVIAATRAGDLSRLSEILRAEPGAANPTWVPGFEPATPVPTDSIPLFCVSDAFWGGTNAVGDEYEIARALIEAGAEVDFDGGQPLVGAVSFNVPGVVGALLEGGAAVDGVDGDGVPMAYALHFAFRDLAELMA